MKRVFIFVGILILAGSSIAVVAAASSSDRSCGDGQDTFSYSLTLVPGVDFTPELAIREALAPARSSLWSEDQIQEAEDEVRELEPGSVSEVAVGDVLVSIERDDEGDYVPLGGSFCTDVVDGRDLQISEGEPGRYDE